MSGSSAGQEGAQPVRPTKAIILPGNGCPGDGLSLHNCMWYGWMARELAKRGIECDPTGFPEPLYAYESVWTKHCLEHFELDEKTLLIGHSSGSACALRLMEQHRTAGCILISAYDSDLGDELEAESGYFDRPFEWDKMQSNTPFILQFHSSDDELVPVAAGRAVAKGTKSNYVEVHGEGHFNWKNAYPIFLEHLDKHLKQA